MQKRFPLGVAGMVDCAWNFEFLDGSRGAHVNISGYPVLQPRQHSHIFVVRDFSLGTAWRGA